MLQPSLWELESFYAPRDVIIIGSGFAGLWSAYYIKKKFPHWSVLVLEKGTIPSGASTRNAGFACFGSVTELLADQETYGSEAMIDLVRMRFRGLEKIRKRFAADQIGYEATGGFELIDKTQRPDLNILRTRIDQLNHTLKSVTGKAKTFLLHSKQKNFGFGGAHHLVENLLEGQLHSGKLCEALLQLVQSKGVKVLTGVDIRSIEKGSEGHLLQSNLPVTLQASKVLVCTNAFAKTLLPEIDIVPARGQILVTSPIPSLAFKGCFHYDEGFYYFRNLGNRILLGGARNKFFRDEETFDAVTSTPVQTELERFLREVIIPETPYSIDYRWSGTMGIGGEKKPVLKKIRDELYCAVRMSGMGVALTPEIGKQVAAMMA